MLQHFAGVSVFGPSSTAMFLILFADFAATLGHTLQEWKGRGGPLWRNFGAIAGVWIPGWLGFALFFVGLTLTQWLVGLVAITGSWPGGELAPRFGAIALGALIGARLTDTLVSHVLLWALGYRPNPGLSTTSVYVIEAVFFLLTFGRGLAVDRAAAIWGIAGGTGFFVIVLPSLFLLRLLIASWRRDRWIPPGPMPPWTQDGASLGAAV